jgi:hypothetical protein
MGPSTNQLPYPSDTLPSGAAQYDISADPYLAKNPYSSGAGQYQLYCSGTLWNTALLGNTRNGIGVWRSGDGGATWGDAPAIAALSAGGGVMLDKPSIAVSWNFSTVGYVYVVYVSTNLNYPWLNEIDVCISTDGGATFGAPINVATGYVHYPSIVVNPNNGDVTVVWRDLTSGGGAAILARTMTFYGYLGSIETVYSGTGQPTLPQQNEQHYGVVVNSNPMIRFDYPSGRVVMTFTAKNSQGDLDVFYTCKPGCSSMAGGCFGVDGWANPVTVAGGANDQIMPAIDYTASGDLVIPYYDVNSLGNYTERYVQTDTNGVPRWSFADATPTSTMCCGNGPGDYQDIWIDNYAVGERGASAWMVRRNFGVGNRDLMLTVLSNF